MDEVECQARDLCHNKVTGVVVTVNGWVIDCCDECSMWLVDPLGCRGGVSFVDWRNNV